MSLLALLRHEPRALGFGLMHATASSVGQTFLIALFLPGIKTSFALDDAQVASVYGLATVASAGVLWWVGRWIDRVDVVHYSIASGLFSSGTSGTLQAAIVAEHVSPNRLGTARSILASMMILASAAGPAIYGWLLAAGVSMAAVLWGTTVAMVGATVIGATAQTGTPASIAEGNRL